jgi:uncharacterized protein (TIGR02147 family)
VKTNLIATATRPSESTCFRLFLQAELGRRCAKNRQYSLRAFAKYLVIDHATLSQLLRGNRPLTARTIVRLGTRLGLKRPEIDRYAAHPTYRRSESANESTLGTVQQLASDAADVVGLWYHYAILELTRLHHFKPNTCWIARVLEITPDEVNLALSRLIRLGLLEMVDRDRWVDKSGDATASVAEFSEVAVRQLFEQTRRLMLGALGNVPVGRYEHTSTTLALCTDRLPSVLEKITRFRRELIDLLAQDSTRDDVYQLEINFFPVTTLQRDEDNDRGTTRDAVADPGQGAR